MNVAADASNLLAETFHGTKVYYCYSLRSLMIILEPHSNLRDHIKSKGSTPIRQR